MSLLQLSTLFPVLFVVNDCSLEIAKKKINPDFDVSKQREKIERVLCRSSSDLLLPLPRGFQDPLEASRRRTNQKNLPPMSQDLNQRTQHRSSSSLYLSS